MTMQREARTLGELRPETAGSDGSDAVFQRDSFAVGGLFPTPLVTVRLAGHAALDAVLTTAILAREAVDRGVRVSNIGGWHSAELLSWCGPAGNAVIDAAREMVGRMTLMELGEELVQAEVGWRVTAWANVSRAGDANRAHGHAGAFWSGIYWVDDGGAATDPSIGGLLELADPRGIVADMVAPNLRFAVKDCLSAGRGETITPQAGTMVLFPAWLIHSVTSYRGPRPRISIAFNFSI
jgi:uncharacterized protein (TIGR02466 family)